MKSMFTQYKLLTVLILLVLPQGLMAQANNSSKANAVNTNVETIELASRQLEVQSSYVGHLSPLERVVIRSEAEGSIEQVHRDQGQDVSTDDVLVNISTERLALELKLSEANYKLAESEYKTEKLLFERAVSTASKVDSYRTARDVKQISLEVAKLNFDKSKVKSPMTGVIKSRMVEVGSFVNKGQNLFEIMDISQVLAMINIPEKEIKDIIPGKTVKVRIDAIPGVVFEGKVNTVGLEADLNNRSFPAEIIINNDERRLLPGMMARVEMITYAAPNQIIIPRHAVLERENNRIVFVEKNGTSVERPVVLGTVVKDEVQVLSGLQNGENLIVTGHHFLADRDSIKVVNHTNQKN
ncbi:MAG: efflux RND transporter periplasmic adaptor subunit [SAR324 cluster bacterium]|nr:efflux RND transporter periplasmic adaptor subunit [SAR324 cluster bacterium]